VGPPAERFDGRTTHMKLWLASVSFTKWLEARQGALGLTNPTVRILELGSGIGWLGQMLAANLGPRAEIVLTDLPYCIETLKAEWPVEQAALQNTCKVRIEAMDWSDFDLSKPGATPSPPQPSSATTFDLVVGADLVWTTPTARMLPCAMHALLASAGSASAQTTLLYAHWFRSQTYFKMICSTCETVGLSIQECTDTILPDVAVVAVDVVPSVDDAESSEMSDDHDWTSQIFDDASDCQQPIFKVYKVSLKE